MEAIFTSPSFYIFYIGIMVVIFALSWYRILRPYSMSKKAATAINSKLLELSQTHDMSVKFHQMNEWFEQNNNEYIQKSVFPAWQSYYEKYLFYQKKGISYTPDVYDFFFEESLVQSFGKRKAADIIAGVFLSLGIVGTFLGIAFGVSGLEVGGDPEVMQAGIGVLLSGMQVKFSSSIVGILLSLLWVSIDKVGYYPGLSQSFSKIRQDLDGAFPTQDQGTLLLSMDQRQEKQMQDFQSFFSEVLIPNMVNGLADSIHKSIAPQMEQTQQIMSDLLQTTTVNQAQGMQQMVDTFVTQLNELTGDHMKNLGVALNSTIEWQQKVHTEMGALVQSMQESASSQSVMVEKTTGLAEQIHSYTEKITDYQEVLEKTVTELNQTTEKNSQLQSVTAELLDKMMEERKLFNEYFETHMITLKNNVDNIVHQTELQVTFQERLEENLQRISTITQSQQTLAVTMAQQADLNKKSNQELEVIFDKFTYNNSEFVHIQDDLTSIIKIIQQERKELDDISSKVQSTLTDQLHDMDQRVEQLRVIWGSASDSMAKTNKHLETSMNQFTDDMHRGLQNTFTQFDQELTKSVQHLASGVDAIQEGIVDLPDAIQALKQAVGEINRQSKRILSPVTSE
ncbi:hypothetical protein E6C60_0848 [Paenibacillus algicola]|uniref:MotA/TolQ/ExbB proton channel domain-containing protein n=1 Tax=Paenibacillus algicola TaxID=2565926 RepID=A0A4P8XMQ1_9BACL|nr:hypothetical protein [Paenibacillus algicola]QCT01569.1 hypothetical protein E6C60_0848 [Paenibacillus algicola]